MGGLGEGLEGAPAPFFAQFHKPLEQFRRERLNQMAHSFAKRGQAQIACHARHEAQAVQSVRSLPRHDGFRGTFAFQQCAPFMPSQMGNNLNWRHTPLASTEIA